MDSMTYTIKEVDTDMNRVFNRYTGRLKRKMYSLNGKNICEDYLDEELLPSEKEPIILI